MAISATSLFGAGTAATTTSTSGVQSRAAALAKLKQIRETAAMSSLGKLGVALAGAKFDTKTVAGVVSYEDNYMDVPTYKRVLGYRTQTTYKDDPIYQAQDVTAQRTIYKTVDVHAMRPTYETHDVMGTKVSGSTDAGGLTDLASSGIDEGSDFSVQVGSGQAAKVSFGANNRITLTVGSDVSNFDYDGTAGSLSGALGDALNSVNGLKASFDAQGKLQLETDNAEPLTIDDVANDPQDSSGSPLGKLGLSAGTTQASVVGTEQVQTGTEDYVASTKKVATGTRTIVTGTEQVQIGTQKVATGTQQVVDSTTYVRTGTTRKSTGQTRIQDPSTSESVLSQASHKKILAATLSLDVAIGPATLTDGSVNPLSQLRSSLDIEGLKSTTDQTAVGIATLTVTQVLKAYQKARGGTSS